MVDAIAVYRTRTGIRRTSATDTLSVDVECYAPAVEGAIDRVEFSVVQNGGAPTVLTVSAASLRYPNYSAAPSPIPGAPSGSMAPLWAYGITLACSGSAVGDITCAYGTTQVTATVYTTGGSSFNPPDGPITLYNDADGTDRRPNPNTVYFHPSGSDAAAGTLGAPKRTMAGAVNLLASLGSGNVSGAKAIGLAGAHLWVGASMANHFTTGHWPLTVEFQDGSTIARDTVTNQFWNGTAGGGSRCYVRFQGSGSATAARHIGIHLDVNASSGTWLSWWDGFDAGSRFWSDGRLSIRYMEPTESGGGAFDKCGFAVAYRSYVSCSRVRGRADGFVDRTDVHDCTIQDFIVLAMGGGGYNSAGVGSGLTYSAANVVGHHGYVYHPDVRGWINCLPTSGQLVVSVQPGGRMRIQATAQLYATRSGVTALDLPIDIGTNCAELVGSTYWTVRITNWTGVTGKWPVVATGTSGGFPYVEVANTSFTAGASPSGAHIFTEYADFDGFDPHGGLDHWFGKGTHGSIHSNIIFYDIQNMQGPFWESDLITPGGPPDGPTHPIDRCALVNYAVSSSYPTHDVRCPIGGDRTNCVFIHNSFNGGWDFTRIPTGTILADNFCRTVGGDIPVNGSAGNIVTHNHVASGSTFGVNASSGAWFANNPGAAPWQWTPSSGNLDTASTTIDQPAEWRHDGATGDSRGVWRNTALQDWTVASAGDVVALATLSAAINPTAPTATAAPEPKASAAMPAGPSVSAPTGDAAAGSLAIATIAVSVLTRVKIQIEAAAVAGGAAASLPVSVVVSTTVSAAAAADVLATAPVSVAIGVAAPTGVAEPEPVVPVSLSLAPVVGMTITATAIVVIQAEAEVGSSIGVTVPSATAATLPGVSLAYSAPITVTVTLASTAAVGVPVVVQAAENVTARRRPWRAPPANKRPDRWWR